MNIKPRYSSSEPTTKQARYVRRHRLAGICLWCPRPAVAGRTLCESHMEKNRRKALKSWRKLQGMKKS
jgi:hypothetical protein